MSQPSWATFCISTFKRPELLQKQLARLLEQSFTYFEIVVSDNDPDASARDVAASFGDSRIRYFHNEENLGMMKSFNKSIDRANTEYIVMVTDDDPVEKTFLADMHALCVQHPGYSVYAGFRRSHTAPGTLELISKERYMEEILDTYKTPDILWSSCVLRRKDALEAGKIPDFGSPHLADHALVAMTGSLNGGVIVNRMYSTLTQHENNFSKFNVQYYVTGCQGFYETLIRFSGNREHFRRKRAAVLKHIGWWFIATMFTLKRYHTLKQNKAMVLQVDDCARQILAFPFMRGFRLKYLAKSIIFQVKKSLHLLKPL